MPASRRDFLRGSVAALGGTAFAALGSRALHASRAPAIVGSLQSRPSAPYGVAAGDVSGSRAVVWSRCDRPARLVVEYSTTETFADPRRVAGPAAMPESGLTAKVVLDDLPPGQRVFYRVLFQDLADLRSWSEPVVGQFVTPPADRRDVTLAWSADTCGQGWGINPDWGGLRLYETMRRAEPDIFVHCGDTVYADQPLQTEVALDDGSLWRNLVTEAKSKVAETIDEFRANHLYNFTDQHLQRFAASVAQVVVWDDHEVRDNWYWERSLERDARYQEKAMALLAARAGRAFLEHYPIGSYGGDAERSYRVLHHGPLLDVFAVDLRSYRGPNSANLQEVAGADTTMFGQRQFAWLKAALAASRATWKVMACSMPIGLVVRDFPDRFEAFAQGEGGLPRGREIELASLLRFIREKSIRNVVWLTGDVHYCAAHHYSPERARFTEFTPFWEFVAGPLHAGTFGPNALDATFGPEVRFVGIPEGMKPNRPPSDGLQFFGTVRIDGATEVMTVKLHDLSGRALYSVDLPPAHD